ncbi:UNKNOWN [Stylonychia lemnae]|uniref:TRP C-terminal domain-containing protein n=1 Tax=Stylonychia lemnae TaxID=5949 RepID=A0A078B7U7_STYLE|nr:UNKNOWN [Stylonychia lemnae]|eukprot:CDW90296.1 UNKNOWN [Stylonychia lemnae]
MGRSSMGISPFSSDNPNCTFWYNAFFANNGTNFTLNNSYIFTFTNTAGGSIGIKPTDSADQLGIKYQFTYTGYLTPTNYKSITVQLTFGSWCYRSSIIIRPNPVLKQTFDIEGPPNQIIYQNISWTQANTTCQNVSYQLTVKNTTNPLLNTTISNMILFSADNSYLYIPVYKLNMIGIYEVKIQDLLSGRQTSVVFDKSLEFDYPPLCKFNLLSKIYWYLKVGTKFTYQIPDAIDPDDDSYKIKVSLGQTSLFSTSSSSEITIQPKTLNIGSYTVGIELMDLNSIPKSKKYSLTIEVYDEIQIQESDMLSSDSNKHQSNDSGNSTVEEQQQLSNDLEQLENEINQSSELTSSSSNSTFSQQRAYETIINFYKLLKKKKMSGSVFPSLEKVSSSGEVTAMKLMEGTTKQASSVLMGSLGFNVILQIVLGFSMKKLWMLINTLQILVHIPMLQIPMPANAILCFQALIDISNLQVIPKEQIKSYAGSIYDTSTDKVDERYSFFLIVGVVLLIKLISKKMPACRKAYEFLKSRLFFSALLRPILKGYLKFCIASFIAIKSFMSGSQDILESIISAIMAIALILCPFVFVRFLKVYKRQLNSENFKQKFGTLYMNLDTKSFISLLNLLSYLLRRLIMAISIVYLNDYPGFQAMTQVLISQGVLIYFVYAKPFTELQQNIFEFYNEISLLVIGYFLLPLSTLELTPQFRENTGWAIIAICMTNLTVNYMSLVFSIFTAVYGMIKKFKSKCKNQQRIAELTDTDDNRSQLYESSKIDLLDIDRTFEGTSEQENTAIAKINMKSMHKKNKSFDQKIKAKKKKPKTQPAQSQIYQISKQDNKNKENKQNKSKSVRTKYEKDKKLQTKQKYTFNGKGQTSKMNQWDIFDNDKYGLRKLSPNDN